MDENLRPVASENRNRILLCTLIMFLYCLFHVMILPYHEAWRDESRAWVFCQNLSLGEIFGVCASEGHPILWFLTLYPFARLGFSFYHFGLISVALMSAAVWIWLYKAPFPLITKLCVMLSPVFFYYNPVICRVYALLLLLLLLIASIWKYRFVHPVWYGVLSALLFQSHILAIGIAIGLMIDIFLENGKEVRRAKHLETARWIGMLLPMISAVCFFLELRQREGDEYYIRVTFSGLLENLRFSNVMTGWKSVAYQFGIPQGTLFMTVLLAIFVFLIFKGMTGKPRRSYLRERIVLICGFSVYWGVIILVRTAEHIQIAIVFWMIVLFGCWIYKAVGGTETGFRYVDWGLAAVCAAAMLLCGWKDLMFDIHEPYSGNREIVQMINAKVPERSVIIVMDDAGSTSLSAYLKESEKQYCIWDIENAKEFSVHIWGEEKLRTLEVDEVPEYAEKDFENDVRKRYFLADRKMSEGFDHAMIFSNSKPSKCFENFWVYDLEKCGE